MNLKFLFISLFSLVIGACSHGGSSGGDAPTYGSVVSGPNVVAIKMGCGYLNEPCVAVTICQPGTTSCQTIDNVLLDTGSYGLRLFGSVVNVTLTQLVDSGGNRLAECVKYGDGSSQWGPVRVADIKLGSNQASGVPIQIVDSTFSSVPSGCDNLDTSPDNDHYNGILGVGLLNQDCGANCVSNASNGVYYTCTSSSCTGSAMPLASQVTNPIGLLNADNNGVVVVLPSLPGDGAINVIGSLILGIGTQSNNTPGSVTTLNANSHAEFTTTYGGRTFSGFIDSGSNAYYFPSTTVGACNQSSVFAKFYCPSSAVVTSAVQNASTGGASASVPFTVGNASAIFTSGLRASPTLSGYLSNSFDWGLPFFLGKTVYVGLSGKSSVIGTGPYWAF